VLPCQKPADIFHHKVTGPEFSDQPGERKHALVTGITLRADATDGKPLARRTADQEVNRRLMQVKTAAQIVSCGRPKVEVGDRDIWEVDSICVQGRLVEVNGPNELEPRMERAKRQATDPTEQIDYAGLWVGMLAHGEITGCQVSGIKKSIL
jgi:hypothetical protein